MRRTALERSSLSRWNSGSTRLCGLRAVTRLVVVGTLQRGTTKETPARHGRRYRARRTDQRTRRPRILNGLSCLRGIDGAPLRKVGGGVVDGRADISSKRLIEEELVEGRGGQRSRHLLEEGIDDRRLELPWRRG